MGSKLDKLVQEINKEWKEDIAARGIRRIQTKKIQAAQQKNQTLKETQIHSKKSSDRKSYQ